MYCYFSYKDCVMKLIDLLSFHIELIGKRRKKLLLNHFGSVKLIENASIEDIKKIDGISDLVANKIYNFFNKNSLISKK